MKKLFSMRFLYLTVFLFLPVLPIPAISEMQQQTGTAEDTLNTSASFMNATAIGGYGSVLYQHDRNAESASADLERMVLFIGHKFGSISFFSELEVEDAKVSGGEEGGEIAFEQAYLKFNLDPQHYITAGLFLPRIGILNENHLPNTFNGSERTQVETYIIPSTWREIGVGFYGGLSSFPLQYSVALLNGLNSGSFKHGTGIREGRFEGRNATANNLALTGSLQTYLGSFKVQVSGYYGGTVGIASGQADSLHLVSGIFGTPAALGEADIQYEEYGFSIKLLGVIVSIPDAFHINAAYGRNTPMSEYGAYAELGYNVINLIGAADGRQLIAFIRYEKLDMNSAIPENGILDGTLNQDHCIVGLGYWPVDNVVIKADARFLFTGKQNPALSSRPYSTYNGFLNLGMGFSF
jgi:hypothetical protein